MTDIKQVGVEFRHAVAAMATKEPDSGPFVSIRSETIMPLYVV
jgi:hypothetical protein